MRKWKLFLQAALCTVFLLCAFTVTAFADDVDDELSSYAGTLASEYGLSKGSRIDAGSGSGNYQLGSASASAGRGLYVIELQTIVGYERVAGPGDNCHMDCAIFYQGTDNKVYWTKYFNFNSNAEDFLDNQSALEDNQNDALSIQLPANCSKILAFYFHKAGGAIQGKYEWSGEWLRIAKVSGSIGSSIGDDNGYKYRDYSGTYMAGISNLDQLNFNGWGHHLWRLNQPVDLQNNSCGKSVFIVEMVAGADGYPNRDGSITLNYTDSLGISYNKTITFSDGYGDLFPGSDLKKAHEKGNWTSLPTSGWGTQTDREITGLGSGYVGNYYTYEDVTDTCLLPYTATDFQLVLPQNISKINSITIRLDDSDNLVLQSVRLFELSQIDSKNYWNGEFGLERTRSWQGRVIAQSNGNSHTISGKSSYTWQGNSNTRGLTTYARGQGPEVDNSGNKLGVTIHFADVLGAGIEGLQARNTRSYTDKAAKFNASDKLNSSSGNDAWKAYYNLHPFYQECMTLELTYKDTLGATRKVSVPYMTTYILYNLVANKGTFSGGSWETWISGILQQNETAALVLRTAQYESMVSVKVIYGNAPYGFTSSNKSSIDTGSDSISLESICIYENVSTSSSASNYFGSVYDKTKLAFALKTKLEPAYSWSASNEQGQKLSGGGSLSATVSDNALKKGAPEKRDGSSKYLVKIKTADIETAGTDNPVTVSLAYTDITGAKRTTSVYSMPTLAGNYYGSTYRDAPSDLQYQLHMRRNCVNEFVVEMKDVATVDSISFAIEGTNEWQVEYVTVYKLDGLEQRWGERSATGDSESRIYWRRTYDNSNDIRVANARQSVLLYSNAPTKTIYFTTFDEDGNAIEPEQNSKNEDYLTSLPSSMTYEEALKDLGLSVVKHTYHLDVEVADMEDAGSTNYFYFQLVFENGSSAVVLANQQLAADSFRQGNTESFQIKTTQNYGNVTAVRIICDNASSDSNVFDKLNIEKISVTLSSDTGISKSWMVENIGWIDINYTDEGSSQGVAGFEDLAGKTVSNAEIVKEFAITRTATAVDLLFCIATSASSANDSADPFQNALGGKFEGTLMYLDSDGVEQSKSFDLTAAIQEYNDTNKTFWLYRPNHVDRFRLSMTDISSVLSLIITRTDGKTDTSWVIDSVSVQQIGGLGEVFLSPELTEYYRKPISATDLAMSTNDSGITYSINGSGNAMITFTENRIDVVSQEESDSWNATISRVPISGNETLNIALYPGTLLGTTYQFTTSSPAVRSTVKYTTIYGGSLIQNAFVLGNLGEVNGQTVLYGKNLSVNPMSSLNSMILSTTSSSGTQPVIGKAIVQRVRGNVIMGTYYFDYGNFNLSVGNPEYTPSTSQQPSPMYQTLTLQLAEGQNHLLTAETSDVAIALQYTSNIDPATNKTVYQTPYVYLTDAGYVAIQSGKSLELTFDTPHVAEVVGLSIVSTGPLTEFDNAIIRNYSGIRGEAGAELMSSAYISQPFTANTMESIVPTGDETVVPVLFTFNTASEDAVVGAGTSGKVGMTVNYTDDSGRPRSVKIQNILRYFNDYAKPTPGTTVKMPLLLSGAAQIDSILLSAEDSWFLTSVSAELTKVDDTLVTSTSVNNWVPSGGTLTVDLSATASGNYIQSFSVSGRSRNAGKSASAVVGSTLLISAYPGDTVELAPAVTAVGNPDTTWTWNPGNYASNLSVNANNSAVFRVPSGMSVGESCTFSVTCNGNNQLTISITVMIEEEVVQEDNSSGSTGSGGTENGGTNNGGTANGSTDNGSTDNGSTGSGGTENGGTNNGGTANGSTDNGGTDNGGTDNGGTDNGGTDNGGTDNGGADNGGTDNGGTDNGGTDNGGTDNGGTDNGGTDNGSTDNGGTDNGGTDNGGTDNGGTDNGGTDNGSTDNGGTDNGGTDNGGTDNSGTDNSGTDNSGDSSDLNNGTVDGT